MTRLEFKEFKVKRIVNTYKHADSWFWNKYSAKPYTGCRSGCEFCYCRGRPYGVQDPALFDSQVNVKINAVERLKKEILTLTPDVIQCGDWQQPAEDRYQLSRKMLEVIRDNHFPLLVVERSPLLARDLDLLEEINHSSWAGVVISCSSLNLRMKRSFEPNSPSLYQRFKTMEKLAAAGILVGTAIMPIIPVLGDDSPQLEETIRKSKDHGATFVLAGSLTLEGVQPVRMIEAVRKADPMGEKPFRQLYGLDDDNSTEYSLPATYFTRIALMVRDLCRLYGLKDRMPRYIPRGPLGANRQLSEKLYARMYDLELEQAKDYRLQAYRKVAWSIDDMTVSLLEIFKERGISGIEELPGIGSRVAGEIAGWLAEM